MSTPPLPDLSGTPLSDASRAEIFKWLQDPRYRATRAELQVMVEAAAGGDQEVLAQLSDAFSGPLPIGTGGRRGRVGPGPNRMNEIVLDETIDGLIAAMAAAEVPRKCVVAFDTRRDSRTFAHRVGERLSRAGIEVVGLDEPRPTPQLSYALRQAGAGGGVMISASHNPPPDNGIKIYGEDGAQVLGERDRRLMAEILRAGEGISPPAAQRPGQITWHGPELPALDGAYHRYVLEQGVTDENLGAGGFAAVFTPLHGVGHTAVEPVLAARGLAVHLVKAQCDPDGGNFSTVRSANPEDPASMDMGRALAQEVGATLVLATDPDADRLGALARDGSGAWHAIDGNRLGALMLDHVLRHAADPSGWVLTTLVTSPLIAKLARAAGIDCVDDLLVGFKHHAAMTAEDATRPLLFACEESHGYIRGNDVRDKDGAIAALLLTECAAQEHSKGRTLLDRLDEIWERQGYHREKTHNIWAHGAAGRDAIKALMDRLRTDPPASFAGLDVVARVDRSAPRATGSATRDLPGNVMVFELASGEQACRLVFRPSGTEPKLKVYALASHAPVAPADGAPVRAGVDELVERVLKDAAAFGEGVMKPFL